MTTTTPAPLTDREQQDLTHWSRWGSDGYPVAYIAEAWTVTRLPLPMTFPTRKAAVAAWENHIDTLIEKKGARAYFEELGRRAAADAAAEGPAGFGSPTDAYSD